MVGWSLFLYPLGLAGYLRYLWRKSNWVLQLLKNWEAGLSLADFQVGYYQSEEGSQLKVEHGPWWSLKSPFPDKDGVGVVDMEVSTKVPSDSSDVVVSGEVWVDLSSISDSESESCGKVLLVFQRVLVFGPPD